MIYGYFYEYGFFFVHIVTDTGIVFQGSTETGAFGNTNKLLPTASIKKVILSKDGTIWTVGQIK